MLGISQYSRSYNRSHPLARGRIRWWNTSRNAPPCGLWYDIVGNNPLTLTAVTGASASYGVNVTSPGNFGSMSFTGAGSYCNFHDIVADNTGYSLNQPGAFSLSAWVWPLATNDGNTHCILARNNYTGSVGGTYILLITTTGKVNLFNGVAGNYAAQGIATIPAKTWTHLVAVYDKVNGYIYINGAQDKKNAYTTNFSTGTSYDLHLGVNNNTANQYFGGYMNSVAIFNRGLSGAEVEQLYNLELQGNPGLLANNSKIRFNKPATTARQQSLTLIDCGV